VVAVLLLAAACADEDGSDTGASGPTGATTEARGSTAGAGDTGSTGSTDDASVSDDGGGGGRYGYGDDDGSDGGGDGGGDADLSIDNFAFSPDAIEVAPGTEIVVENANGSTPHTFTVEGTDVDLELGPGDVEDVAIDLDPGTYDFRCRFHPQMTGTLTVV
jgi:plastocyanin